MPTTYAAYSNLTTANNASKTTTSSAASSMPNSQRNSVTSETSQEAKKMTRWQRFVDDFKPIEQPVQPVGLYTPIPVPSKRRTSEKDENSKSRKAAKAYQQFKVIVGGPLFGPI